jgi:hypothetical protein
MTHGGAGAVTKIELDCSACPTSDFKQKAESLSLFVHLLGNSLGMIPAPFADF